MSLTDNMEDKEFVSRLTKLGSIAGKVCVSGEGTENDREIVEQAKVMMEALEIYAEREESRGGLWKEDGVPDSAHHLKSKAGRLMTALSRRVDLQRFGGPSDDKFEHEIVDSALDAVNYAVFAVRNWREGRR